MSYDLDIKADDDYSQSADCDRLKAFVAHLPGIKPNGSRGFVLDDRPQKWMEIDLEAVSPDGDYDEELSRGTWVNCVRLHIPYAYLGETPERDYFPTAWAIAAFLGWRLHQDKGGE